MTFLSRILTAGIVISTLSVAEAQEKRLTVFSPGFTNENRLVIRDAQGRVQFTMERTITGNLVVKDKKGSVVGRVTEPPQSRTRRTQQGEFETLSLPRGW